MSIILETEYEDKEVVKKLGARYDGQKKKWYIPDGKDWRPFNQWIPQNRLKELEVNEKQIKMEVNEKQIKMEVNEKQINKITMSDIFSDISNVVSFSNKVYEVEGDISSCSVSNGIVICNLIDNHNIWRRLRVCYPEGNAGCPSKIMELKDKRVRVVGRLNIYKSDAVFQLYADTVVILGPCSRLKEIEEYEKICKDILIKKKEQFINSDCYPNTNQIGIITSDRSQALEDFKDYFKCKEIKLNTKQIKLVASDIANEIRKFNNAFDEMDIENMCDYIVILRGGGDPELLIEFAKPELLREIYNSEIKIITGVGHVGDKLLCGRVAYYDAKTPTGAGVYLNRLFKDNNRRDKDIALHSTNNYNNNNENKAGINSLYSENKKLKEELSVQNNTIYKLERLVESLKSDSGIIQRERIIRSKDDRIGELEETVRLLNHQLELLKNRGLLDRLFNRF